MRKLVPLIAALLLLLSTRAATRANRLIPDSF